LEKRAEQVLSENKGLKGPTMGGGLGGWERVGPTTYMHMNKCINNLKKELMLCLGSLWRE
jgi:hypothetical protein